MRLTSYLAYLDPGAGSMIVQLLVGGTAAVAVGARLYWRRLRSVFRRGKRDEDESAP